MIGLDTNIVIRFLVQDQPAQAEKAKRLFASLTEDKPGYLSLVTLAEIAWVLRAIYKLTRQEIVTMMKEFIFTSEIVIERYDVLERVVEEYAKGRADFADYLIAALNHDHGCKETVTFDRIAAKTAGMRLL